MLTNPKIEFRNEQPFVAIFIDVAMKDIPSVLPPMIPEVIEWLTKNNIAPDRIMFFHYLSMTDNAKLHVAVGMTTQTLITGDERFQSGILPAGNYAMISNFGDYSNLYDAHYTLEKWLQKKSLDDTKSRSDSTIEWFGRTEFYISDPATEPNPEKWQTDVAFLIQTTDNQ